jgi:hypothetical protein
MIFLQNEILRQWNEQVNSGIELCEVMFPKRFNFKWRWNYYSEIPGWHETLPFVLQNLDEQFNMRIYYWKT